MSLFFKLKSLGDRLDPETLQASKTITLELDGGFQFELSVTDAVMAQVVQALMASKGVQQQQPPPPAPPQHQLDDDSPPIQGGIGDGDLPFEFGSPALQQPVQQVPLPPQQPMQLFQQQPAAPGPQPYRNNIPPIRKPDADEYGNLRDSGDGRPVVNINDILGDRDMASG